MFCSDQFLGYLFGIKSDLGISEGCVIYMSDIRNTTFETNWPELVGRMEWNIFQYF